MRLSCFLLWLLFIYDFFPGSRDSFFNWILLMFLCQNMNLRGVDGIFY